MPDPAALPTDTTTDAQRQRCTQTLRLIWAAMLMGQLVLAGVVFGGHGPQPGAPGASPPWLGWLPMGLLLLGLPVSYFVRNQFYKRHWRGHGVAPPGYTAGNLVVFAVLEGVVIAGLIVGVIVPAGGPARAAAAAAFVLMLLNFPSGRPREAQPPGLGARSERSAGDGS